MTPEEQHKHICENIDLAYRMAKSLHKKLRLPHYEDIEELTSDALLGLTYATKKYNPQLSSFRKYAAIKIRGAIIDGLRERDHLTRKERKALNPPKLHSMTIEDVRLRTCQLPAREEIQLPQKTVSKLIIRKTTRGIDKRLKTIIEKYFLHNITMKEIGMSMGVTETRICQLMKETLKSLNTPKVKQILCENT